ncbi:CatB-related O-acetyltransferase [Sporosarcina sp. FSL K6-3457]|uniref:CatB-related O-acetyltransferase n=1 Tax=Sporosarcina sp. FSL K6-3457 TaxID=2978204 RepID=UPI0030FBB8C1
MNFTKLIQQSLEAQTIAIWGTGTGGFKAVNAISIIKERIVCFVDSYSEKEYYLNFKVLSPLDFFKREVDLLVIASSYVNEIKNLLLVNKYDMDKVLFLFDQIEEETSNVDMGRYSYGLVRKVSSDFSAIESIGNFTSINGTAAIGAFNHPIDLVSTHSFLYREEFDGILNNQEVRTAVQKSFYKKKIKIGHDVWIGANAIILPGVEIGNGAVIGAGAVVTKDVPPFSIVGGVPAKVIKFRFDTKIIEALEEIKWWYWDDNEIKDNVELFLDPYKFIEEHYRSGR